MIAILKMEKKFYTTEEFLRILDIDVVTLWKWRKKGLIDIAGKVSYTNMYSDKELEIARELLNKSKKKLHCEGPKATYTFPVSGDIYKLLIELSKRKNLSIRKYVKFILTAAIDSAIYLKNEKNLADTTERLYQVLDQGLLTEEEIELTQLGKKRHNQIAVREQNRIQVDLPKEEYETLGLLAQQSDIANHGSIRKYVIALIDNFVSLHNDFIPCQDNSKLKERVKALVEEYLILEE